MGGEVARTPALAVTQFVIGLSGRSEPWPSRCCRTFAVTTTKAMIHLPRVLPALGLTALFGHPLLAQVTQFGTSCPASSGNAPTIAFRGAPFANQPLTFDLTGPAGKIAYLMLATSNTQWSGVPLPLSLAGVGNPGCSLLVGPELPAVALFDAQGHASLTLPLALPAGFRVYAQAVGLFGSGNALIDGATEGLEITMMTPTTQPVIASLSSLTAEEGQSIVIRGANFGSGTELDLCIGSPFGPGTQGAFFRALSRTSTEIVAELISVPPNLGPTPIGFVLGSGSEAAVPTLPGATFGTPAFGWSQPNVTPANMFVSTQTVNLFPSPIADASCTPCAGGKVHFNMVAGKLEATLPATMCDGARFLDINLEPRWTAPNGQLQFVDHHIRNTRTCGLDRDARANLVAFLISFSLASRGVVAFASPGGKITAQRLDGGSFGYGYGSIKYDYPVELQSTRTDGLCDNFAPPTEPTTPSPAVLAWKAATAPAGPVGNFDQPNANYYFLHSAPLPAGPGTVVGVSLQLTLKALGDLPGNDTISIGVSGGNLVWTLPIASLPGITSWASGQTAEVCLDLANLPASSSGVTNVLAQVLAAGGVDIVMQDDSAIDCLCVTVQRCQ